MWRFAALIAALAVLGVSAAYVLPEAHRAIELRLAADDPARLAELRLQDFDAGTAVQAIETALAEEDLELAESFAALADARGIALPEDLLAHLSATRWAAEQWRRTAVRFGRGLFIGDPDGYAGMAGATTGDLLLFGDVRDLAREGKRWVRGQAVDPLMVGLASVGLAVTAGTYALRGAAAPARVGVSVFKAARRSGRVGVNLASDMSRLARGGRGGRAAAAFTDIAAIQNKAGGRAALEGLRHAGNVGDLARLGRLADANGRATLAVLKTLGRGAIVLGAGALAAAWWVMGAATNVALILLTITAIFAWTVRALWRTGRLAWRGGRYAAVKLSPAS